MMSEEYLAGQAGRRLATDTSDWLTGHPETRNAKGEHVVIPAPRDMRVADLIATVGEYDHPVVVIFESAEDRTTMVIASSMNQMAGEIAPYPATLTVGDFDGLHKLFGDGQVLAVSDEKRPVSDPAGERWRDLIASR